MTFKMQNSPIPFQLMTASERAYPKLCNNPAEEAALSKWELNYKIILACIYFL